ACRWCVADLPHVLRRTSDAPERGRYPSPWPRPRCLDRSVGRGGRRFSVVAGPRPTRSGGRHRPRGCTCEHGCPGPWEGRARPGAAARGCPHRRRVAEGGDVLPRRSFRVLLVEWLRGTGRPRRSPCVVRGGSPQSSDSLVPPGDRTRSTRFRAGGWVRFRGNGPYVRPHVRRRPTSHLAPAPPRRGGRGGET